MVHSCHDNQTDRRCGHGRCTQKKDNHTYFGGGQSAGECRCPAREFSVSRQIIVGDVALLRAAGLDIAATPRGYVLPKETTGLVRTVACVHPGEAMARELEIMVDQGCQVMDVVVEHPVYGQLTGQLRLASRYDVQEFVRLVSQRKARPLSDLTGGVHLHTLRCPDEDSYRRVLAGLKAEGFLYPGE